MTLEKDRPAELFACAAVGPNSGLKTVRLSPDGRVKSLKGEFLIDEEAARSIVQHFTDHATDLPVDAEHSSLGGEYSPPDGIPRAYGWIKRVWRDAGKGLFALVGWTEQGAELIRSGAMKYVSPVLMIETSSRRAVRLHSAALTNLPALGGQDALVASSRGLEQVSFTEGKTMELLRELKAFLGLEGEQTPEQVLTAALERLRRAKASETVSASVRDRLGLKPEAADHEILLTLDARLVQTASRASELDADEIIRQALSENKVCAHDKPRLEWLRSLALSNAGMAREVVANLSPWAAPGSIVRDQAPSKEQVTRSRTIREAMSAFRGDAQTSKMTSEEAFINCHLRDRNFSKLTTEETAAFSVAV